MSKTIIVTGANKGIGKSIVKLLATDPANTIYLTARSEELGNAATKELLVGAKASIKFAKLDLLDLNNNGLESDEGQLTPKSVDVLINNAGIAKKGDDFDAEVLAPHLIKIVRWTMATNYFATRDLTLKMLPFIKDGGRVINISSRAGLLKILSNELAEQFRSASTIEQIDDLMAKFENDVKDGSFIEKGWPRQAYGVSKIGNTAMIKVFAAYQEYVARGLNWYACCPG